MSNTTTNDIIVVFVDRFAAVDCGPPPLLEMAYISSKYDATTLGSHVTFSCVTGFGFTRDVFSQSMACGEDGNWTSPINRTACTGM